MKKIGKLIKIAFLLVVGATFADQINGAVDYLSDVDYALLGDQIATIAKAVADFAVSAFNWIAGLFESAPVEA